MVVTRRKNYDEIPQDANNNPTVPIPVPGNSAPPEANTSSVLWKNPEIGKCQFCRVDLNVGDGVMLQDCLHVFCKDCLQSAIEMQQDVAKVPCPFSDDYDQKCGSTLSDAEVKELVSPEKYQEYIDRSLVIAKKKMKNVFTCKTLRCEGWCEIENNRKTFDCPVCHRTNCVECGAIHTGVNCAGYKDLISTGRLSKLEELKEKDQNSGWSQMVDHMKDSNNPSSSLIEQQLVLNTRKTDCPICFTDIDIGEGVILQECYHVFCKTCLINLVEHNDDALVKCPHIDENYSCTSYLQAREIKALVPPAIYEKHLLRSVKLGESQIENSFHCKTPDCPGWCEYGQGARRFDCPICKKPNCIQCNAIHKGSCEDYKNSMQQDKNSKLSEAALEELIKAGKCMKCPKCKIHVQKTAGCDWLMCSNCRTEICWATRGPRWGPRGHGDTTGGCRCRVNGKKCHPKCMNCH